MYIFMTLFCFIINIFILFISFTDLLSKSDNVFYKCKFKGDCGFAYKLAIRFLDICEHHHNKKESYKENNLHRGVSDSTSIFSIRNTFFHYIMVHICFGMICILLGLLFNLMYHINENWFCVIDKMELSDIINIIITITIGILTVSAVSVSFILRSTERQQDRQYLLSYAGKLLNQIKAELNNVVIMVYKDSFSLEFEDDFKVQPNGFVFFKHKAENKDNNSKLMCDTSNLQDMYDENDDLISILDTSQIACSVFVEDDISKTHRQLFFNLNSYQYVGNQVIFDLNENEKRFNELLYSILQCEVELRIPILLKNIIIGTEYNTTCFFSFNIDVTNGKAITNVLKIKI